MERPGESLDESLERLQSAVNGAQSLADVFDHVMPGLDADNRDDIGGSVADVDAGDSPRPAADA